jgi:hypothetical protein
MIALKAPEKRLDRLEVRTTNQPDIVELVLQALSDDDLVLLHELASLRESGFNEEQTYCHDGRPL